MKQSYTSLKPATGLQVSGICLLQVAPREWLATDPVIDFTTGRVTTPLSFIAGKSLLTLELTADSYDYTEKPKSSRGGTFYDIGCVGTLNELTPESQQVLESLRHHELVLITKDRKKRLRLIGTKAAGCVLQVTYRQASTSGGVEVATIDLSMECEERPPFYL